jgi:hypothetical protein
MFEKEELNTIYNALCYYSNKQELKYDKEESDKVDYLIAKTLSAMGVDIYPPNNQEG